MSAQSEKEAAYAALHAARDAYVSSIVSNTRARLDAVVDALLEESASALEFNFTGQEDFAVVFGSDTVLNTALALAADGAVVQVTMNDTFENDSVIMTLDGATPSSTDGLELGNQATVSLGKTPDTTSDTDEIVAAKFRTSASGVTARLQVLYYEIV